jgi:hypothetical protein
MHTVVSQRTLPHAISRAGGLGEKALFIQGTRARLSTSMTLGEEGT